MVDEDRLKRLGFTFEDDGIYYDATTDHKVAYEDLCFELLKMGVVNIPLEELQKLYESDTPEKTKVCDEIEEYDPIKDDYIRVTVSRDRLEAYLDVTYPGTDIQITIEDVMHKVYEADVVHNLDDKKIHRIITNKIFAEKEIIARGREPEIGQEAQVIIEVDTDISTEPLILDDGTVDFRQVSMLKTVEKEQLLAVKIPATKGTDGIDVLGNPIDSTGPDKALPAGKNTVISEDGLSLFAACNGRILREKDLLSVENILAIEGDVDYSTGNIDFNGDVAIGGDVLTGFRVKAEGDVRIKGTVEGAEIISTENSVYVTRGIVGQMKARILAKKNVRADFINEATVEAGGDVEVGEYIINSIISADNEVRAAEGRGMMIGGKIYAGKSIECKVAGSPNNVRTEIRIGGKIDKEMYEKMLLLEKDLETLEKKQKALQKEIEFIQLLKKKLPSFPERKVKQFKELLVKLKETEEQLVEQQAQKAEMEKEMGSTVPEDQKKINVNTMHRGVLMGIDQNKMLAEYTYKLVLVFSKEGEMKLNYKSRFV